jgi:hypothetical protein
VRPDRVHSDLVVRACDPSALCTEQRLVLTIVDARQRPALERIGDKQVDEGKPLQVFIRAVDPDHELVELTATPLPAGATFVDEGTGHGTLLWKPGLDQAGTYNITVKAFDGSLEDAEAMTITVRETSLTISGIVEDEFHKPFQGATIALSRPGDHVREAITNAKGRYLAPNLPPGAYTIKPEYRADPSRPTPYGYHFSPLSRRVELGTSDQRDINFEAVEN